MKLSDNWTSISLLTLVSYLFRLCVNCVTLVFIRKVAEDEGFEPSIPIKVCWFSRPVHSTTLPIFLISGGARGNRTHDLLIANQSLSQLSYSPKSLFFLCTFSCVCNFSLSTRLVYFFVCFVNIRC